MYYSAPISFRQITKPLQVRADVYPAQVSFPNGAFQKKARVIVTADTIYVLIDAQGPPGLLYEGRLEDYTGDRRSLTATTEDGDIVVTRSGGCGCGSKLKSYRPYTRAVRMATV